MIDQAFKFCGADAALFSREIQTVSSRPWKITIQWRVAGHMIEPKLLKADAYVPWPKNLNMCVCIYI